MAVKILNHSPQGQETAAFIYQPPPAAVGAQALWLNLIGAIGATGNGQYGSVGSDVYFTGGHLFHGAVVDGDRKFVSSDWKPERGQSVELGKIIWGEDLIAVE